MNRCLLFLFLMINYTQSCFANIGDSEPAIGDRYGKTFGQIPTSTFGVMTGFIAGGYVIGVKFVDGISEMEMFCKGDQSDMGASEIDRLLKKNSAGDWKAEVTGKPQWRRWRRDDGSAVALYDATRHFLYINSKNFYEVKAQQIEQQEWSFSDQPAARRGASSATPSAAPISSP
jgi:hypothetical protein